MNMTVWSILVNQLPTTDIIWIQNCEQQSLNQTQFSPRLIKKKISNPISIFNIRSISVIDQVNFPLFKMSA